MSEEKYIQIPKMLAVLAHDGDYHYIDRLGNSHARPLALYYLREALRDFNALKRSPPDDMHGDAKKLMHEVNEAFLEVEIENIKNLQSTQELREVLSLICAKALAKTSRFIEVSEKGQKVEQGEGE